ncbi:MAG: hypothetical protein JW838_09725 [Spirochaetes bacterium]|nr:hypothetical protein [Spirochaetota bacterium]
MTETTERSESPEAGTGGKGGLTLFLCGLLCIIIAFSILYRAERTGNRRWIASRAELIDPKAPGDAAGMVRFSGLPEGDFVADTETGRRFVYLSRSRYEYRRGDGAAMGPGWRYAEGSTEFVKDLRIGVVRLRLEEAEIMGRDVWSKTITRPERGAGAAPRIGDVKIQVSGIPEGTPLFCVGRLAGDFLGTGKLFLVSTHSEGKTLDELSEVWVWRWIRHPLCFFLILAGFVMLGRPAMAFVRSRSDHPALKPLARIGWPPYLVLSLALSFVLVRYSRYTADLLWVVVVLAVGIPVLLVALKMKARKNV